MFDKQMCKIKTIINYIRRLLKTSDYEYRNFLPNYSSEVLKLDNGLYIDWDNINKNLKFVNRTNGTLYINYAGFIQISPEPQNLTPINQNEVNHSDDVILKNNSTHISNYCPIGNGDRVIMSDFTIHNLKVSYALNYNLQNINGNYRLFLVGDKTLFPVARDKQ